jgi:hypothetical protein
MKRPEHLQSLSQAIERLHAAEVDVLQRIAKDAKPEDREEYRDIRDTIEAMESEVHGQKSLVVRVLKALHLIPK